MGQIVVPGTPPALILSAVDRLVASNADGGLSPLASHIILLGENAGQNLGDVDYIIVIGADSLSGGFVDSVGEGTVILGSNIFTALTNNPAPVNDGPNIAIGYNIAPAVTRPIGRSILIGSRVAFEAPALPSAIDTSVVIGNEAIERQRTQASSGGNYARRAVIIGDRALRGNVFTGPGAGAAINEVVVIGAQAAENSGFDDPAPATVLEGAVIIGTRAARGILTASGQSIVRDVLIGFEVAGQLRSGASNVMIGERITTASTEASDNVLIGAAIAGDHQVANGGNVVLGARSGITGMSSRNILIGTGANAASDITAGSDHLLIETTNSGTAVRRNLVYGNMGSLTGAVVTACGIAFGLSSAANRDLPGMNIVKIINGNRDAGLTAPVGGGYFYSTGGELHWVSSTNVDYALTPAAPRGVFLVAALPVTGLVAGQTAYVSDALAPAFGAAPAGGGAVFVPVFYNGAAWIVG